MPKFPQPALRSILVLALLMGLGFRFYQVEHKIFWGDEIFTAMRASGYTATEVTDRTYTGQILSLFELHQYQHPGGDRTLSDTLHALEGSPEHSPLYFLMARFWMQHWGHEFSIATFSPAEMARSVWVIRSLSVAVSLLVFPGVYWLSLELFRSPLTGWISVAMLAVSPFHLLYAQEARGYSLWTVTILLSSAALLRALRRSTWTSWGLYALTVALGLYAFLFSGLVAIAHGIYVLLLNRWRWSRSVKAYFGSTLVGVLLFSPWLWVMTANLDQLHSNVAHLDQAQPALVQLWLLNLSRIFFDFNHGPSWINPLIYITLILSSWAICWLCRYSPQRVWLFVLTLIGVMGSVLILSDLIMNGQRSGIARYPIPCYLGIQLAVAAWFADRIDSNSNNLKQQKRWQRGLIGLLFVGVLSCAISSQAELWWNKGLFKTRYNPQVAELINQSDRPLIISDSAIERVLSLSYLLKPQAQFQLVLQPKVSKIPDGFDHLFLYQPSIDLRQQIEAQYHGLVSQYHGWVWQTQLNLHNPPKLP
jgi:uncharacterized membrane protein